MGAWVENKGAAIKVRKILRLKHKDVHFRKLSDGGYKVWIEHVESEFKQES